MQILPAKITDATALTEISFRSKAHWGYSPEQMEIWRDDLTITQDYIRSHEVFILSKENQTVGYYSYQTFTHGKAHLDNLFILPEQIGKGYGKILMQDFLQRIKNDGYRIATLNSDPHAEAFYLKLGFKVIGQFATSIEGRFLPVMEKEL